MLSGPQILCDYPELRKHLLSTVSPRRSVLIWVERRKATHGPFLRLWEDFLSLPKTKQEPSTSFEKKAPFCLRPWGRRRKRLSLHKTVYRKRNLENYTSWWGSKT
ncbi:MAG: hypothetical protein DRN81_05710 [Thermoproteota archaeon]|nr:MAG: hypothetical protein DRN81_05710 [Candidatus Korarchaeota archaeon]